MILHLQELMDIITLTHMFAVFMLAVLWHDRYIAVAKTWSLVETVYFWIVTFTTVNCNIFLQYLTLEENT